MSDPVVLLHAFPLDPRMWDGLRPALGSRLITPDHRGFPSLDAAASSVLATLDEMDVSQAVFGGCSMGGYVAMAALRADPSRVSGLILINTKASADTPEAAANRHTMAERVLAEGVDWVPDAMLTTLLGETTRRDRPSVAEHLRELITDQPPDSVALAQRAMAARPDSFDVLRAARVPALIVRGTEDQLIPAEEATSMSEALRDPELVELVGVGHLAPLESPEPLAEVITSWLDRPRG